MEGVDTSWLYPIRSILTPVQQKCYDFVYNYQKETGRAPTYAEIAEYMGYSSRASAYQTINYLIRKKHLYRDNYGRIRVADIPDDKYKQDPDARMIPVVDRLEEGKVIIREEVVKNFFPIMNDFYPDKTLFIYKTSDESEAFDIRIGDYLICSIGVDYTINEPLFRVVKNKMEYRKIANAIWTPDGMVLGIMRFIK